VLDLDILAAGQFITAAFLIAIDNLPGPFIHHLLAEPVAGLTVDLMKVGLLGLA
jgi:hypothetical protein